MNDLKEGAFDVYRTVVEKDEEQSLSRWAARSQDHHRLHGSENDHRLPYQRDVDRILHSSAYARYANKTQVAYLVENDHISQRGLHVQLVSQFSRGIASILRLNTGLIEAVALGHDVGHPPFGHEGEGYLSTLSMEVLGRPFAHPWQSCHLFSSIEPLNLGLAVYDGFLCHDGGLRERKLVPCSNKTWKQHECELEQKLADPEGTIIPMTLEGCLVKVCDTISYTARDLEDAIRLGLLQRDQVPQTCLGTTSRDILNYLARDIIENSYEKGAIILSEQAFDAIHQLRDFNFQFIYNHPKLKVESAKIERSYRLLFYQLGDELQSYGEKSSVWTLFSQTKGERYCNETDPWQMVVDYVACMTDRFFIRTVENWLIPKRIEL